MNRENVCEVICEFNWKNLIKNRENVCVLFNMAVCVCVLERLWA